jgi:uncharacterized membrane protein YphA (DoxX/SURF4 family)/peroxiredoxin
MRILLLVSRLVVGSLFIVSGLIKANDPLGFSYKLEEYFAESALNLPFLEPFALLLAVLACLAEVVLGFAVLFGGRMKLATASLMVLTIFFGWLTAYTATCDPSGTYTVLENGQEVIRSVTCVTDCGCFGDAMKGSVGRSLTPWESFSKDAILFVFILPLFIASFRKPGIQWNSTADDLVLLPFGLALVAVWSWVFTWWGPVWFTLVGYLGYLVIKRIMQGPKAEWTSAGWATLITLGFAWWCYAHLPLRDYRPYAIGKSIAEQKVMSKPPVQQIFMSYKHLPTGEVKEYDAAGAYPWDDPEFAYVDRRIVELERGIESPVQDFLLTDMDGYDITDDVLVEPTPVLLVMTYNVEKSSTANVAAIRALAEAAFANGWYVYGVSSSPFSATDAFRHEHQLPFDYVQCDEKTIKTAIRANPGIILLKEGTVMGKWHANDTPTFEEVQGKL